MQANAPITSNDLIDKLARLVHPGTVHVAVTEGIEQRGVAIIQVTGVSTPADVADGVDIIVNNTLACRQVHYLAGDQLLTFQGKARP